MSIVPLRIKSAAGQFECVTTTTATAITTTTTTTSTTAATETTTTAITRTLTTITAATASELNTTEVNLQFNQLANDNSMTKSNPLKGISTQATTATATATATIAITTTTNINNKTIATISKTSANADDKTSLLKIDAFIPSLNVRVIRKPLNRSYSTLNSLSSYVKHNFNTNQQYNNAIKNSVKQQAATLATRPPTTERLHNITKETHKLPQQQRRRHQNHHRPQQQQQQQQQQQFIIGNGIENSQLLLPILNVTDPLRYRSARHMQKTIQRQRSKSTSSSNSATYHPIVNAIKQQQQYNHRKNSYNYLITQRKLKQNNIDNNNNNNNNINNNNKITQQLNGIYRIVRESKERELLPDRINYDKRGLTAIPFFENEHNLRLLSLQHNLINTFHIPKDSSSSSSTTTIKPQSTISTENCNNIKMTVAPQTFPGKSNNVGQLKLHHQKENVQQLQRHRLLHKKLHHFQSVNSIKRYMLPAASASATASATATANAFIRGSVNNLSSITATTEATTVGSLSSSSQTTTATSHLRFTLRKSKSFANNCNYNGNNNNNNNNGNYNSNSINKSNNNNTIKNSSNNGNNNSNNNNSIKNVIMRSEQQKPQLVKTTTDFDYLKSFDSGISNGNSTISETSILNTTTIAETTSTTAPATASATAPATEILIKDKIVQQQTSEQNNENEVSTGITNNLSNLRKKSQQGGLEQLEQQQETPPTFTTKSTSKVTSKVTSLGFNIKNCQLLVNYGTIFANLIFLDLYDNQIERITNLDGLTSLSVLLLGKNRITDISGLYSVRATLRVLDLHGNRITSLCNKINCLHELKSLNLAGNQIRQINHNDFNGLDQLKELNLKRNRLKRINGFQHLKVLERLWLCHNDIHKVEDISSIVHATNLEEITIENNPVSLAGDCVSYLVSYLPKLQSLSQMAVTELVRKAALIWRHNKEMAQKQQLQQQQQQQQHHHYHDVEHEQEYKLTNENLNIIRREEIISNARTNWELLRTQQLSFNNNNNRINNKQQLIIDKELERIQRTANETICKELVVHNNVPPTTEIASEDNVNNKKKCDGEREREREREREGADSPSSTSSLGANVNSSSSCFTSNNTDSDVDADADADADDDGDGDHDETSPLKVYKKPEKGIPKSSEKNDILTNYNVLESKMENINLMKLHNEKNIEEIFHINHQNEQIMDNKIITTVHSPRITSTVTIAGGNCVAKLTTPVTVVATATPGGYMNKMTNNKCSNNNNNSNNNINKFNNNTKSKVYGTRYYSKPHHNKSATTQATSKIILATATATAIATTTANDYHSHQMDSASNLSIISSNSSNSIKLTNKTSASKNFTLINSLGSMTPATVTTVTTTSPTIGATTPILQSAAATITLSTTTTSSAATPAAAAMANSIMMTPITKMPSLHDREREQGGDYLIEICGRHLNIYGQGALRYVDKQWNANKANDVHTLNFSYINFNNIVPLLQRIKLRFPNAENFIFRETNITQLGQINALAELQGITTLFIDTEGNHITTKQLWRQYAIYRLSHWGLKLINDQEITADEIMAADTVYKSLTDLIFWSIPETLLQPLLVRLSLEESYTASKLNIKQWLLKPNNQSLRLVVSKEALQWTKQSIQESNINLPSQQQVYLWQLQYRDYCQSTNANLIASSAIPNVPVTVAVTSSSTTSTVTLLSITNDKATSTVTTATTAVALPTPITSVFCHMPSKMPLPYPLSLQSAIAATSVSASASASTSTAASSMPSNIAMTSDPIATTTSFLASSNLPSMEYSSLSVRERAKIHITLMLENTCNAVEKLHKLETLWPSMLLDIVRNTLIDYSQLDIYVRNLMSELMK